MSRFFEGVKLGFGFIFIICLLLGIVYAVGFHNPSEILDGTFSGDYIFTGDVKGIIPSGAIMAFYMTTCPEGWKFADGTNDTPDLRGEFIRGWDNSRGIDINRTLGSNQSDAIRNIEGYFEIGRAYDSGPISVLTTSGVFERIIGSGTGKGADYQSGSEYGRVVFNVSKVVPTANENRPRNVALLYCVKE